MRSGIATAPQKGKPLCRLLLQSTQGSGHSRQRISTQAHYILWKHPILETGAMPLSPTPIGTDIQDRGYGLRRILLPRTWVSKSMKKRAGAAKRPGPLRKRLLTRYDVVVMTSS